MNDANVIIKIKDQKNKLQSLGRRRSVFVVLVVVVVVVLVVLVVVFTVDLILETI